METQSLVKTISRRSKRVVSVYFNMKAGRGVSEVKSNFPKNEQIIIADVMADGAAQMKNGNDNVDELTTIMAHSNFDAKYLRKLEREAVLEAAE